MKHSRSDESVGGELVPAAPQHELAIPERYREKARDYIDAELSENTRAAYASDWKQFTSWCEAEKRTALPATPGTVIGYMVALADAGSPWLTITRRLSGIDYEHGRRRLPPRRDDGAVRAFLKGLRKTIGVAPRRKKALLRADLEKVLRSVEGDGLVARRDRALLLLGFAGAFRRSELAGLDVERIQWDQRGLRVQVLKSKTDQEGRGQWIGIPAEAGKTLDAVRALVGDRAQGPLFQAMSVKGVARGRLRAADVGRVVLRALERAKMMAKLRKRKPEDGTRRRSRDYGAHSLRAGFITQARQDGKAIDEIMTQSRHRSVKQAMEYVRHDDVFVVNAARGVAL